MVYQPQHAYLMPQVGGRQKRHYKNSYNYMTRIKIPIGSLASNGKYTAAEDCSCTNQSVNVGLADTVDEPQYSVYGKSHPTYVLNSPGFPYLSLGWIRILNRVIFRLSIWRQIIRIGIIANMGLRLQ